MVTLIAKSNFFGRDGELIQTGEAYQCDDNTARLIPASRAEPFDPNKHGDLEELVNREGKAPVKRGRKSKADPKPESDD